MSALAMGRLSDRKGPVGRGSLLAMKLVLQLSFRLQSRGALAIYHGEQGLMVDV